MDSGNVSRVFYPRRCDAEVYFAGFASCVTIGYQALRSSLLVSGGRSSQCVLRIDLVVLTFHPTPAYLSYISADIIPVRAKQVLWPPAIRPCHPFSVRRAIRLCMQWSQVLPLAVGRHIDLNDDRPTHPLHARRVSLPQPPRTLDLYWVVLPRRVCDHGDPTNLSEDLRARARGLMALHSPRLA